MPCTVSSLSLFFMYCSVTPVFVLFFFSKISSPTFYSRHFSLAVFILMQLYCLYYTDEGHCIVAETFDPNLRTICRLLFGWCESEKKTDIGYLAYFLYEHQKSITRRVWEIHIAVVQNINASKQVGHVNIPHTYWYSLMCWHYASSL